MERSCEREKENQWKIYHTSNFSRGSSIMRKHTIWIVSGWISPNAHHIRQKSKLLRLSSSTRVLLVYDFLFNLRYFIVKIKTVHFLVVIWIFFLWFVVFNSRVTISVVLSVYFGKKSDTICATSLYHSKQKSWISWFFLLNSWVCAISCWIVIIAVDL